MAHYTAAVPGRVGVFGGTFDPPHVGHLVAAVNVAHQLGLDRVLFVVANVPWQKVGTRAISSAPDRLAMVEYCAAERDIFDMSAMEIHRGGDSVTADTLEEMHGIWPNTEFHLILGSDAAVGLPTWRRSEAIPALADIVIVDRPGSAGDRPPPPFTHRAVPCPLMDVSSTDIRTRVREGLPIDYLVPTEVASYIATRGLYR